MIQKTNQSVTFEAFFTAAKVGKTALSVTVDIYSPSGALLVTSGAATETGGGFYRYTLTGGSTGTGGAYRALFKTVDTSVDLQHVPSLWEIGVAGVDNLDATVSSRSTFAGGAVSSVTGSVGSVASYGTLVVDLATAVWATGVRTLTAISDSTGVGTLLSRLTAPRSANLDNLDATVSSRSTFAGGAVASVTAPVTVSDKTGFALTSAYDAAKTALTTSAYVAPDNAGITAAKNAAQSVDAKLTTGRAGNLDNLDAQVSSRLAADDYVPGSGGSGGSGTTTLIVGGMLTIAGETGKEIKSLTYTAGDQDPDLLIQFRTPENQTVDLTNATVTFDCYRVGGLNLLLDQAACTVVSAELGYARYSWGAQDLSVPGTYKARFYRTAGDQRVSSGALTITVKARRS